MDAENVQRRQMEAEVQAAEDETRTRQRQVRGWLMAHLHAAAFSQRHAGVASHCNRCAAAAAWCCHLPASLL